MTATVREELLPKQPSLAKPLKPPAQPPSPPSGPASEPPSGWPESGKCWVARPHPSARARAATSAARMGYLGGSRSAERKARITSSRLFSLISSSAKSVGRSSAGTSTTASEKRVCAGFGCAEGERGIAGGGGRAAAGCAGAPGTNRGGAPGLPCGGGPRVVLGSRAPATRARIGAEGLAVGAAGRQAGGAPTGLDRRAGRRGPHSGRAVG